MAIPDGKPATDFNAMDREWVKAVAKEAVDNAESELPEVSGSDNGDVLTVVGGVWAKAAPPASGIPAPASPSDGDVLTYDSATSSWVAEAPSGGDSNTFDILLDSDVDLDVYYFQTVATAAEIVSAYNDGKILTCNREHAISIDVGERDDLDNNSYWTLHIGRLDPPADQADTTAYLTKYVAEVLKSDASTEKFKFECDDTMWWEISVTVPI